MSDLGDDSDFEFPDDYEWLYVEDHYDQADELAEHTCPSPVAQGSHAYDDYDPYDYWEDLAYLSDAIYDQDSSSSKQLRLKSKKKDLKQPTLKRTGKRKADSQASDQQAKRRRTEKNMMSDKRLQASVNAIEPHVLWKATDRQEDVTTGKVSDRENHGHAVAILKDWKERFNDQSQLLSMSNRDENSDEQSGTPNDQPSRQDSEPPVGEGFDLYNIQSVAELLGGDSLEDLKNILIARGLDADAVEVVLKDLITGNEPEFEDSAAEEDDDVKSHDTNEETKNKHQPVEHDDHNVAQTYIEHVNAPIPTTSSENSVNVRLQTPHGLKNGSGGTKLKNEVGELRRQKAKGERS